MYSKLATPPHSTGSLSTASPIEPIIIPPPSFGQYQKSLRNDMPYNQATAGFAYPTAASPNIIALAELFATLKHTLTTLSVMFEGIGNQTERLISLGPGTKAAEQMKDIRTKLEKQIHGQEESMQEVRHLLESAIHEDLIKQLKRKIYDTIRDTISKDIKERVHRELIAQIPEHLRQPQPAHQERQGTEIQINVTLPQDASDQAADGKMPSAARPLRPLLRPLPTPAQSPAYVVNSAGPSVGSANETPVSAFLTVPEPTPVVMSATFIPRARAFYFTPPTRSPLVPNDLLSLFSLSGSAAKPLSKDCRIDDEGSDLYPEPYGHSNFYPQPGHGVRLFPRSEQFRKPLGNLKIADPGEYEINTFNVPIGVPFLMVPAPNPKGAQDNMSLSPVDEPRRLLTPLTIGKDGMSPYINAPASSERPRLHIVIPT